MNSKNARYVEVESKNDAPLKVVSGEESVIKGRVARFRFYEDCYFREGNGSDYDDANGFEPTTDEDNELAAELHGKVGIIVDAVVASYDKWLSTCDCNEVGMFDYAVIDIDGTKLYAGMDEIVLV